MILLVALYTISYPKLSKPGEQRYAKWFYPSCLPRERGEGGQHKFAARPTLTEACEIIQRLLYMSSALGPPKS